jgi:CDP-paratose 2-epimerase
MKLLVTGAAGFVGSTLIDSILESESGIEIVGLDNLIRPGSELNRKKLQARGVRFVHGDVRVASDFENLPPVDWVIDAAANPSVLAGIDGKTSSRQVIEHNLGGTINMLEYCRKHGSGFILLSTSRVYSIKPLAALAVTTEGEAFAPELSAPLPAGLTAEGITESFSTQPPLSLYGAGKLASETIALEYGDAFDFDVWINRCGVLAGAGQFGRPDQGIFSFWIHSWLRGAPLQYIGFDGKGRQVRDCLHPRDIAPLLRRQMNGPAGVEHRIQNLSGGLAGSMSLAELSAWCSERFTSREVDSNPAPRPFDLPWVVLDSARAGEQWDWKPQTPVAAILEEIAAHAEANPDWLEISKESA